MYAEYHYDDMHATSKRLNDILNEGISVENIKRFVDCGMVLKWEGLPAQRFRNDLQRMTLIRDFNESVLDELHFIANYPKVCADRMAAADEEVAAKIRAIFK